MINQITLSVPDEDLAESLANCKEGEEKTITFTVTEAKKGMLTGDVTEVDGYESDESDEGDTEDAVEVESAEPEKESYGKGKMRKMPRAIVLIGAGK